MASRKDIPFLLNLLDDQSHTVQQEVVRALKSFGPRLEKEVAPFRYIIEPENWLVLEEILDEIKKTEFSSGWMNWLELGNSKSALEQAMINLSFLEFGAEAYAIEKELDRLANDFREWASQVSVNKLMEFLFQYKKFKSPEQEELVHLHDSLLFTLRQRKGSQISLSSIAVLVGWRLDMDLYSIDIQGNYMTVAFTEHKMQMYNTFKGGEVVQRSSALYIEEAFRRNCLMPSEMKAQVHETVAQIIRNHIDYFHKKNRKKDAHEYVQRFSQLMSALKNRGLVE
ncbi:MAG: transglutaminase-like domain-containing protein [Bacteroidia bacterium]|nr:transglutaminase-like domain-containing protein [Bacteroidia bacterium]